MDTLQSREEISDAFRANLTRFADLVRPLTPEQLATPSRCEGWTVGDVAGHFIGSIAEIAAGDLDGQGTPAVTERQVTARRGWTGTQLADEMDTAAVALGGLLDVLTDEAWNAPAGGGFEGSLGRGIEALLYDGAVHADDIDVALDLGHHPTQAELDAAVSHVAWSLDKHDFNAILALDGYDEIEVGTSDNAPRVKGNPAHFVLVATGRGNPADFDLDETVNIYR